MDAIGKAIRAALAKGNAGDPHHREQVYRSAQHALESALDKEGVTDPAVRETRRRRLLDAIGEIEQEYLPATAPGIDDVHPEVQTAPQAEPTFDRPKGRRVEPDVRSGREGSRAEPFVETPEPARNAGDRVDPSPEIYGESARRSDDVSVTLDEDRKPRRERGRRRRREPDGRPKRRPYAWMLLILTLLVFGFLGVGFWMASNADYEFALEQFLKEPELGEDFTPAARLGSGDDDRAQVDLYDAASDRQPEVTGNLSAELVEAGQSRVLSVKGGGNENAAIVIPVTRQQLTDLSGLPYTVAIRALSNAEGGTTLLVSCDFAGLGDCGTRRYQVEATAGDLLFAGTMGDGTPESNGSIRITLPDEGSELEIIAVTLLVGDT